MANTTELKTLPELVAEYGVQAATTGILAPTKELADALTAASAEAAQPVAWRYQDAAGHYRYRGYVPGFDKEYSSLKPIPLFLAPQASQPIGQHSPTEQLSELLRGLHAWPALATVSPHVLYEHGKAVVEQARRADELRQRILEQSRQPVSGSELTPRVDALMSKWDDDGATRGAAFCELRDLARKLERSLLSASGQASQSEKAVRDATLEEVMTALSDAGHGEAHEIVYRLQSTLAQQTDYERCQHPECGRFKDRAGWGCRAMRDGACGKDDYAAQQTEAPVNVPTAEEYIAQQGGGAAPAARINCWNTCRENVLAAAPAPVEAEAQTDTECGCCGGTGRMVRDPDIGTDQECFACDGTGKGESEQPAPEAQQSEKPVSEDSFLARIAKQQNVLEHTIKDAERYRWLREHYWFEHGIAKTEPQATAFHYSGEKLDELVDAAIAKEQGR